MSANRQIEWSGPPLGRHTMIDTPLQAHIDALTSSVATLNATVLHLVRSQGARLSRKQVCERLNVCSKTLTSMVRRKDFPDSCIDGQWLLAEIVEWEQRKRSF